MTDLRKEHMLSFLDDESRLKAYENLIAGCTHLYSKNKLQIDKLESVLNDFIFLAENDPVFLAHLTSYIFMKTDNKDLKVVSAFASSLSDADGTPFSKGSKYRKPNLRMISQAAIQMLDPKLVLRVLEIAGLKQELGSKRNKASHMSRSLVTSVKKYLRYRESNPVKMKSSGFSKTFQTLYRKTHIAPSTDVANALGWKQKDGRDFSKVQLFDFTNMSDLQIAEKIQSEKISTQSVLGALTGKISPVIAAAILEQSSGNQAIILQSMWESQGLMKDKEVMNLFNEKISTATTAVDRIDKINSQMSESVKTVLRKTRSQKRKNEVGDIGKVFMHIDASPSMDKAIEFAKERGAIIAEAVKNPGENFFWGYFHSKGKELKRPKTFEKEAFQHSLYGLKSGGYGTDCLALWEKARKHQCDIDIFVTDGEHNTNSIKRTISVCDGKGLKRPRAVVIVHFKSGRQIGGWGYGEDLKEELQKMGIPCAVIKPDALTESALVAQTIKQAIEGPMAVLDAIMDSPLLTLPKWWDAVKAV